MVVDFHLGLVASLPVVFCLKKIMLQSEGLCQAFSKDEAAVQSSSVKYFCALSCCTWLKKLSVLNKVWKSSYGGISFDQEE